ncbi:hypothetical protein U9M48_005100 [Paspalum notatum var. saurae]|uniref:Uncharacterized protein n=1 Tax=Paspalum notatum var. saurae TaxID=547442 RepID=A0AAQ3PPD9_PASNO
MYISACSSSSACATCAAPFFFPRQSLAQWPVLPQLSQRLPRGGLPPPAFSAAPFWPSWPSRDVDPALPRPHPRPRRLPRPPNPDPLPELSCSRRALRRASQSSSQSIRRPMASVTCAGLSRSSNTRRRPITSSIVALFRSTNISMETAAWFRLLGTTCSSFLTTSVSLMLSPRVRRLVASAVIRTPKSVTDSPSLKVRLAKFRRSCCALASRALVADPERPDRVPGLLHGTLRGESAPEFGWNRTQEARHRLSIVVVLVFVGIVGDAVVDGVPDAEGLEFVRVSIGHATFADGRSTMRSTTRDPESRWRERRLWERPRRRGGERDDWTFFSPEPSPVCGFLEGDCDAMATARTQL